MKIIKHDILDFKTYTRSLMRRTMIWFAFSSVVIVFLKPTLLLHYIEGNILGLAYLWLLTKSAQFPERKLSAFVSVGKTGIFAFLIALLGEFEFWKIGVVFWGFLSYKLMLTVDFIRYSAGLSQYRGKRSGSSLDAHPPGGPSTIQSSQS